MSLHEGAGHDVPAPAGLAACSAFRAAVTARMRTTLARAPSVLEGGPPGFGAGVELEGILESPLVRPSPERRVGPRGTKKGGSTTFFRRQPVLRGLANRPGRGAVPWHQSGTNVGISRDFNRVAGIPRGSLGTTGFCVGSHEIKISKFRGLPHYEGWVGGSQMNSIKRFWPSCGTSYSP
jgi:hypothetical protein